MSTSAAVCFRRTCCPPFQKSDAAVATAAGEGSPQAVGVQQPLQHLSLPHMSASGDTLVLSREQLAKYPDSLLTVMASDVGGDTLDVPEDDAHRFRHVGGVYRCGPPTY